MDARKAHGRFLDLVSGRARGVGPACARGGLWLASQGYRLGVAWKNWRSGRRDGFRAAVPVISIGNLTVGGTGKTPCVELIARWFRDRDTRPVILSRGYGSQSGPNDEALVLEENLPDVPHLQGVDRVALAQTAVEELEAELILLDDGFQHRRLHRDLDIVLVDATNPWGYGHLLPRGLLREPTSSLRRAGVVIVSKCRQAGPESLHATTEHVGRRTTAPVVLADHVPVEWRRADGSVKPPTSFAGRPVAAFCGLGSPESFRATLRELGVEPALWQAFPDHHSYRRDDVEALTRWALALPGDGVVLTTQKDAVKLRLAELAGRELWSLRVGMALRHGPGHDALELLLQRYVSQPE